MTPNARQTPSPHNHRGLGIALLLFSSRSTATPGTQTPKDRCHQLWVIKSGNDSGYFAAITVELLHANHEKKCFLPFLPSDYLRNPGCNFIRTWHCASSASMNRKNTLNKSYDIGQALLTCNQLLRCILSIVLTSVDTPIVFSNNVFVDEGY